MPFPACEMKSLKSTTILFSLKLKCFFSISPYRSLPGSVEQKELISDADEPLATSPPLELRRPGSGPLRSTIAVPHSLQSPQDRATGKNHYQYYARPRKIR